MIYAGLINFNSLPIREDNLTKTIEFFTQSSVSIIRNNALVLCYGKLSPIQDMDEIWENDTSILMGRAFDKERSCTLGKTVFKDWSLLSKEFVLNKIWGKYVYININNHTSQFDIVVDPTGQLPFFYYNFPDESILFSSDIECLFKILDQQPEYDWKYLCSYLIYGNSSAIQTPFKNIFELPPACSLKITKNERKITPFWDPLSSYKKQKFQKKDAVHILQDTLKPWIEPYKNIIVSLSGGLDSSSLVYSLKGIVNNDQTLKAINYFHSDIKSSNELPYAQKVCKETGIELIAVDASDTLPFDLPQRKKLLNPNKPFPGIVSLRWIESILDCIHSEDPFLFVSGHGSDHIFMRPPSKRFISDYILEQGLKGAKRELDNISEFYRDSFFPIVKDNIKSLLDYFLSFKKKKRNLKEKIKDIPPWVNQSFIQNVTADFSHPIYHYLSSKTLPGKYDQIDAVYEGFASIHVEEMDEENLTFYPFLYEPVIEFALSFPTYQLLHKGYDRYPLRKAVSDHFKAEVAWRRDKSQTTGIFQLGIKKNLDYVLELCLEGQFAQQGLIHKDSLRQTIVRIGNGDVKFFWFVMHLASAEIFLRYWMRSLK